MVRSAGASGSLPGLVDRLRWDRRRHPHSGRREYAQAVRGVIAIAEQVLATGDAQAQRALVPQVRKAVDRVTRALQYADDSGGVLGNDLRALMVVYARACCAAPPSPVSLASWLVALVWDGPGWPQVRLVDFAPALGSVGLTRIADLVAERSQDQAGAAVGGQVDPHRWRQEWAARELREADRRAEAIDWARRGLEGRVSDPHADRLRDLLVELLVEVGDPQAALAERWSQFRRRPIAAEFTALRETASRVGVDVGPVTDEAVAVLRARVGEEPRFTGELVAVLLAAGRSGQAWEVAVTDAGRLGRTQLVELLALRGTTHPREVIEPYQELIEGHILDSRDKWRYERALKVMAPLRAAHRLLGDDAGWGRYVEELRERHRIRPTFLRKLAAWLAKQDGAAATGRGRTS